MLPEDVKAHPTAGALQAACGDALVSGKFDRGELTIVVDPEKIVGVCRFLKDQLRFVRLSTITGMDWYPAEPRFEVVYHLLSVDRNKRLRLKCKLPGKAPEIDSVTPVWPGANWYERETFDLFGVRFRNHPDLRRIMLPEDWEGHPLRKDASVTGSRV